MSWYRNEIESIFQRKPRNNMGDLYGQYNRESDADIMNSLGIRLKKMGESMQCQFQPNGYKQRKDMYRNYDRF